MALEPTSEQLAAIRNLAGYDMAIFAYVRDIVLEAAAKEAERSGPDWPLDTSWELSRAQVMARRIRALKGAKP